MPNLLSDELRLEIASIVRDVIRNELAAHKTQTDEPLLTPEELADRLRIPVSWVYEGSRRGDIPTVRIGRYIRFHLSEVLANEAAKLRNGQRRKINPSMITVGFKYHGAHTSTSTLSNHPRSMQILGRYFASGSLVSGKRRTS